MGRQMMNKRISVLSTPFRLAFLTKEAFRHKTLLNVHKLNPTTQNLF